MLLAVLHLYSIFYGSDINRQLLPVHKKLVVLEDIDCCGMDEVVKKRNAEAACEQDPAGSTKSKADPDKASQLSLGDLLEAFDGIMEMKGVRPKFLINDKDLDQY